MRLTVAGRRFLDRARIAFAEIDREVTSTKFAGRGVDGALTIKFLPSLIPGRSSELRARFRDAHSDVAIELFERSSKEQLAMLLHRRIDVAFCIEGVAPAECDTQLLWSGSVHAAFLETHPLSGCDIVEWEFLKGEHFIFGSDATAMALDKLAADRIVGAGGRTSFETHDASRYAVMRLVALRFGIGLARDASAGLGHPGIAF